MGVCPLCNGLREVQIFCENCGDRMDDQGKVMDYYGNYSPYMDIDSLKKIDGYETSLKNGECPHLMLCPSCRSERVVLIKE
ncbi:hypothetical protein CVD28_11245 [Bacillus sp. M6-12]|uniref:hypothetical protein n=1 Tax=Bacillus sp. M6-12 TaxID=2054166 RepID=UPI000C76378D|nr:hypothetical protein [Bacillus sp. M6-12]PLS17568.1 hypothetical protein CVD28_11245 [Bacillus sp. M6-12]